MKIERRWAMPSMHTFTIKPIAELLARYVGDGAGWVDPFAGENSPAEFTNDLNPAKPTRSHMEAQDFLKGFRQGTVKGCLFDPPYSVRQVKECYEGFGRECTQEDTQMNFWSNCKNQIARIVRPSGIVICCGWTSMGIGKKRGFEMLEILLVPHGGTKNDTIITVERKVQTALGATK